MSIIQKLSPYYTFRFCVCLLAVLAAGSAWTIFAIGPTHLPTWCNPLFWAIVLTVLACLAIWWSIKLYRQHVRKVLFLLDAIENNDGSLHFSEQDGTPDNRLLNHALNRVSQIMAHTKQEVIQQEKYYELILNCVDTGIVVLNDKGAVYQKNEEALRLLGLTVLTHLNQLNRIDPQLATQLASCRAGNKLQVTFHNERGTMNLSVRTSEITVHGNHLRILALNDINNELDEKEIDSWTRLTRVLTHEIMNSVTPITSLSDTLLQLVDHRTADNNGEDEIRQGLQTISSTGKGLLSFVESYRRFTRIPTPEPSLFFVKGFVERMVQLARHQFPEAGGITFDIDVNPDDLILHADENLIGQVVTNLLRNAVQAISEQASSDESKEGRISIRARCDHEEAVLIEISNNGPAIPAEVAEHIFIPFFTTREGGNGIGLSISRQIMRLSGGSLSLIPAHETTFLLKFN